MTPNTPRDAKLVIIGAGRVGISLGILLKRAGYKISAASARTEASRERAAKWLDCPVTDDPVQAVEGAGCVLIAAPDDSVEEVARRLAESRTLWEGVHVVHTSGSLGTEPLTPVQRAGAWTFAVHPLQSVPDIETGIERIPGSWFGITCDEDLRDWAEALVTDLQGRPLWVAEEERPAYHLAAVMASNFLVTLAGMVEESPQTDVRPFLPLMRGTLANIEDLGPAAALTGPVARADATTIALHLATLASRDPGIEHFYRAISLATVRWASKMRRLDDAQVASLLDVLDADKART